MKKRKAKLKRSTVLLIEIGRGPKRKGVWRVWNDPTRQIKRNCWIKAPDGPEEAR